MTPWLRRSSLIFTDPPAFLCVSPVLSRVLLPRATGEYICRFGKLVISSWPVFSWLPSTCWRFQPQLGSGHPPRGGAQLHGTGASWRLTTFLYVYYMILRGTVGLSYLYCAVLSNCVGKGVWFFKLPATELRLFPAETRNERVVSLSYVFTSPSEDTF